MSDHANAAITTLNDLAERWRHCARTIRHLAAFYGLDASNWLVDEAPAAPVINGTKRVTRGTKGVRLKTRRGTRQARPTTAPTETQERILAALKEAGEPVSPGELAKAVKMIPPQLRYHLKSLIASGVVSATGKTADRRLAVP